MPIGRSIGRLLAVVAIVAGAAACGVDAEPVDQAAPAEPTDRASADPAEQPPGGGATLADADAVEPRGGQVAETVDRDGTRTTLFVGDSVLVGTADDLAMRVDGDLVFDAADCRRLGEVVDGGCGGVPAGVAISDGVTAIGDAMDELAAAGVVPDVAVLVLANNSTIEDDQIDAAMELLADVPQVWWVNARIDGFGRQDYNNTTLAALDRREEKVGVIDWFGASDDPSWFRDHVHPNDLGQRLLAALIDDHLDCGCVP